MPDADLRHGRLVAVLAGGAVALGVLGYNSPVGAVVGVLGLGLSVYLVRHGGYSLLHSLFWLAGAAGTTATALFAWTRGPQCVRVGGEIAHRWILHVGKLKVRFSIVLNIV